MALQRKKPTGIWRELTEGDDPARVHARALTPAERQQVQDAMFDVNAEVKDYMGANPVVSARPEPKIFRAQMLEVKLRVDEWENVLDLDGTAMVCTPENVETIAREIEGFIEVILDAGKEADAMVQGQIKEKEKNFVTSQSGSQSKRQAAKLVK